jgi:hypothetical protein
MARHEAEEDPLPTAADQDARVGALQRLRIAARLLQPVVAARERGSVLGPEELLDAERLVELRQPDPDARKVVPVAVVLGLEPARPHPVDEPAAREDVDGGGHLRNERRRAVGVAGDEDADPDPARLAREGGEERPGLHLRLLLRADDRVEVVVEPDRVEAEGVRLPPVRREGVVGNTLLGGLDPEPDGGWHGRHVAHHPGGVYR